MTAIWITLFALGLVAEGYALWSKKRGDTLSEKVWVLRAIRWARAILMPLWAWLTYHFFLEPRSLGVEAGVWWDDWTLVGFFVIVAVAFNMYAEPSDN